MLRNVNFNLPFVLETDASDFASWAVLLQPKSLDSTVQKYTPWPMNQGARNKIIALRQGIIGSYFFILEMACLFVWSVSPDSSLYGSFKSSVLQQASICLASVP